MPPFESQWLFNGLFTTIGLLGGWLLNSVKDAIKELQHQDARIAEKVQHIEVLVAGKYATRDEFHVFAKEINDKLDKIYQKIDGKADR